MSGWLIQRQAPHEPACYWGAAQVWLPRREFTVFRDILQPPVPSGALEFPDFDAALDVAEWLRANQPLAYGEVIAIVSAPEVADAR